MLSRPKLFNYKAQASVSPVQAKQKTLSTYKAVLRATPYLIREYQLDLTPQEVRLKVRADFEANKSIKDVPLIDMLNFKARVELDEAVRLFKTKSHVVRMLSPEPELDIRLVEDAWAHKGDNTNTPRRRRPVSDDFLPGPKNTVW